MSENYGKNTSAVKSAIKKGGNMAGGKRRGPAAPNMRKGNPYASKKGK
jgi:hypothetical protein